MRGLAIVLGLLALTTTCWGNFQPCMEKCKERAAAEKEAGCTTNECISKFMSTCMSGCMSEAKIAAPPGDPSNQFELHHRDDMPEDFMGEPEAPRGPPGGLSGSQTGSHTQQEQAPPRAEADPINGRPNLNERPPFGESIGDFGAVSPWRKAQLAQGWTHVDPDTTFAPLSFHIDHMAQMHFRGMAIPDRSADTLLFQLPAGLEPNHALRLPCTTAHKACYITITREGEVHAESFAEWLSLDGVHFTLRDLKVAQDGFEHPGTGAPVPPSPPQDNA